MITVSEVVNSMSIYPIPEATKKTLVALRGLELTEEISEPTEFRKTEQYQGLEADVLMWLSNAPDLKEQDISYSLAERNSMKLRANALYRGLGEMTSDTVYQYEGTEV